MRNSSECPSCGDHHDYVADCQKCWRCGVYGGRHSLDCMPLDTGRMRESLRSGEVLLLPPEITVLRLPEMTGPVETKWKGTPFS